MAEKLSITIALQGGKAIEQQLEGIGQAGQKAFEDIAKSAEKAGGFKNLKPEEVTAKLKDMGIVGTEAFNKIKDAVASASNWERVVGAVQSVEKGFTGLASAAAGFARALGPIGVVAGTVGAGLVKVMSDAAEAINKADAAAIKLGISIEKFSQMKTGFQQFGASAGAIASGIEAINQAAEAGKIEAVTKAIATLKEAATRGYGGQGTAELNLLIDTAQRVGPAADAAKKGLQEFGVTLTGGVTSLGEFITKTGSSEAGLKAFVTQLVGMTDIQNRNALAVRDLSAAFGTELVQGINNGTISLNNNGASIDALIAKYPTMTQAQANAASQWEQSVNKMKASWETLRTTLGGKLVTTTDLETVHRILGGLNTMLTGATWEQWSAAARQAFISIFEPVGQLEVKLANFVATLGGDIWSAFSSAGTAAIDAIVSALDKLWEKLKGIGSAIAGAFGGGGTPGSTTPIPGNARGGWIGGRGTGTSDSNLAWLSRGEYVMPASAVRRPGVLSFLEMMRRSGGIPGYAEGGEVGGSGGIPVSNMVRLLDKIVADIAALWPPHQAAMAEAYRGINQAMLKHLDAIQSLVNSIERQRDELSGASGNASGGLLGGRGTGTSDSNLAWVSRGEHIMPARAVRQPGVLALLEALRRNGGNLRGVMDGMGRFAAGGMVPRVPALATSGGGMGHLGTVDLRTDHGTARLMAGASAMEQLSRLAVTKRITSTGRKPSWQS